MDDRVLEATEGRGVDVVLEAAAGEIGEASFKLAAPLGRVVLFGAKNIHEPSASERIRQLIYKNQSVSGFTLPSMRREQLAECVSHLLNLIVHHKLKLFAKHVFPLEQVRAAFDALASRQTLGKVVLIPSGAN